MHATDLAGRYYGAFGFDAHERLLGPVRAAFDKYFVPSRDSTDRHDVLVCHGNVIRYFVTRSLRVDTLSWLQMSIGNCSLTIIRVRADGSTQLVAYSDVGHLPANLQTRTGGENEAKKLTLPEEIEN